LTNDFAPVVADGLDAKLQNPNGATARKISLSLLKIASENASEEEKKYLPIIQKRITKGNVSEIVRERVRARGQKTDLREAILSVYLKLVESLIDNKPYF
jgi:hypothetical protein